MPNIVASYEFRVFEFRVLNFVFIISLTISQLTFHVSQLTIHNSHLKNHKSKDVIKKTIPCER